MEKKIKEISKGKGNETLNSLILEKDAEIQSLKKKLKISHDSHVETTKLKVVLQEKQALETKLQDNKAIVGTFQNHKEVLESQIQILKNEIEQLSLTDPNFSIANELGKLLVKDMEVKTLQEHLAKAKQDALDKDKLLQENLANQESLTQQLRLVNNSLIDAKHIVWDHLLNEVKRLNDDFVQVEDERQLATSYLDNLQTLQENLGDEPF